MVNFVYLTAVWNDFPEKIALPPQSVVWFQSTLLSFMPLTPSLLKLWVWMINCFSLLRLNHGQDPGMRVPFK